MTTTKVFGISLPSDIKEEIDYIRGDISRSLFIRRILEINIDKKLTEEEKSVKCQEYIQKCIESRKI
jgi:metal-responsive CopG/Arc/MetJ family transcriptional regulator